MIPSPELPSVFRVLLAVVALTGCQEYDDSLLRYSDGGVEAMPDAVSAEGGDVGMQEADVTAQADADASSEASEDSPVDVVAEEATSSCSATQVDCDGDEGNGCETDLTSDASNCGECGRSCLQGSCAESRCMPFVLAADQSTPTNVAIDDTHVYWTNQVPKGAVKRVGLMGGPPEEVAAFDLEPGGLFVDSTHIYWSEFGSPGSVRRLAKTDIGDPAKAEELAKDQPKSLSVAVDANNVYFTTSQTIRSVSKSGGTVKEIASNQNYPAVLIASYGFLYWTSTFGGFIAQANTSDLDAGVQLLVSNQSSPGGLTVDLGYLYWANYLGDSSGGTPRIMTLDKAAATAPVVLADGQAGPTMVAQFGTHVYWTNSVGGTIMRVPKAGGTAEELASGQQTPGGIAVDTTAVYWVNRDDGTVMALAR